MTDLIQRIEAAKEPSTIDPAQDAINRLGKAIRSRRGVRFTADEVEALSFTILGQIAEEADPRAAILRAERKDDEL